MRIDELVPAMADAERGAVSAVTLLVTVTLLCAGLPLLAFVAAAAATAGSTPGARSGGGSPAPTSVAVADIPSGLLALYAAESLRCDGLPWTLLAGIAKVDSDHGRSPVGGSPVDLTSSEWSAAAVDADDGVADVHDAADVVATTVHLMCPRSRFDDARRAVARHRPDNAYIDEVIGWTRRYGAPIPQPRSGRYALPFPPQAIQDRAQLSRPHHDYAAVDVPIPAGTAVFAITDGRVVASSPDSGRCGGTLVIEGDDGATYTYCHLSRVDLRSGDATRAGDLLGASGGQPGAPGAGNTTGAHLHLEIRVNGSSVCPQALLVALFDGREADPRALATAGCVAP